MSVIIHFYSHNLQSTILYFLICLLSSDVKFYFMFFIYYIVVRNLIRVNFIFYFYSMVRWEILFCYLFTL